MKKFSIILTALCGLFLFVACAKPDIDPAYDMDKYPVDCSVRAAYCYPAVSAKATQITGVISKEADEDGKYLIEFAIPKVEAKYYDLTQLKIKFNLDYDVYVTPSLVGIHDLDDKTEDVKIYSPLTKEEKVYTLKAYYSRN